MNRHLFQVVNLDRNKIASSSRRSECELRGAETSSRDKFTMFFDIPSGRPRFAQITALFEAANSSLIPSGVLLSLLLFLMQLRIFCHGFQLMK